MKTPAKLYLIIGEFESHWVPNTFVPNLIYSYLSIRHLSFNILLASDTTGLLVSSSLIRNFVPYLSILEVIVSQPHQNCDGNAVS